MQRFRTKLAAEESCSSGNAKTGVSNLSLPGAPKANDKRAAPTNAIPSTCTGYSREEFACRSLPHECLLGIASQRDIADSDSCAATFRLLATGRSVRLQLNKAIKQHGLSEARFMALVALHAIAPEPSTPADLAYHADITRTAMTETLEQLESNGLIRRAQDSVDHRVSRIHLTRSGHDKAEAAIVSVLNAAAIVSGALTLAERNALVTISRSVRTT